MCWRLDDRVQRVLAREQSGQQVVVVAVVEAGAAAARWVVAVRWIVAELERPLPGAELERVVAVLEPLVERQQV